jgi:hypothetical protein
MVLNPEHRSAVLDVAGRQLDAMGGEHCQDLSFSGFGSVATRVITSRVVCALLLWNA